MCILDTASTLRGFQWSSGPGALSKLGKMAKVYMPRMVQLSPMVDILLSVVTESVFHS